MLVRHVAAMASGHLEETYATSIRRDRDEIVRGFLLFPPDRDPGTVFAYNQPCTYTLAAIIQRVSGQPLTEYLRPRLFDPLGIGETAWLQRPPGVTSASANGCHDGRDRPARPVLFAGRCLGGAAAASFLDGSRKRPARTSPPPTVRGRARSRDWQQGYGYQFWRSRHGYRGDGAYGQFCLVLPEHDAVIATTAATEDMQGLLNLVWRHLLPAFGAERLPAERLPGTADEGLRRRLAELALPPVEASPEPPARGDDWRGAVFAPEDGERPQQRTLTGVTVTADADGKGWGVSLAEDDELIELRLVPPVGPSTRAARPPRSAGGWTDQDTLRLDVLFLETLQRLTVTCSLPDGTFTVRWHTTPIHGGRLHSLRRPWRSGVTAGTGGLSPGAGSRLLLFGRR